MLFFCSQTISNHLSILVFFLTLGFALNYVAYKRDFYTIPTSFDTRRWTIKDSAVCLAIYLLVSFLLAPFFTKIFIKLISFFHPDFSFSHLTLVAILQSNVILLTAAGLTLYFMTQRKLKVLNLWKDSSMRGETTIPGDFAMGFVTWFIAFPLVAVVHQLCELINTYIFKVQPIDQVAVQYLKFAMASPFSFFIALLAIIIAAPIIEEFIFRGCLQNTLRGLTSPKVSIILSSIIFSVFHYAPSQKASNFPLLASLFVFAWYLGFLYEKRRSLFTSIALHMTFNAISVFRILLA